MNRYAKIPLPATGIPSSYDIKGWKITTVRNPILSSGEIDAATEKLRIPMPEMIFGNNYVEVSYTPPVTENTRKDLQKWCLRFDTLNSLDRVDKTGTQKELVQVAHSKAWQKSSEKTAQECPDEIHGILKPYDWTYTTDYKGDLTVSPLPKQCDTESTTTNLLNLQEVTIEEHGKELYEKHALPFDKLRTPDPILFYDEVVLYEDELGDNGIVSLSVKVRVMAERLLLLSRLFLRVDGVMFRVRDTRVYIEFAYNTTKTRPKKSKKNKGTSSSTADTESSKASAAPDVNTGAPLIIREYTEHEESYDFVKQQIPRSTRDYSMYLRDENWVAAHMPVKRLVREYCYLPVPDSLAVAGPEASTATKE